MKSEIDTHAQANIEKLSQWISQNYAQIEEKTIEAATMTDQVSFATIDTEVKIEVEGIIGSEGPASYGYGTLALGSVAVLAYLFKKQQETKEKTDEDDEDFQRVVHDQLMDVKENDEDFIRVEEDDFDM